MIKYLFILINSFIFFVLGWYDGDNGIKISHTIPATLVAGQEIVVELKINKGGMGGFAKLQLELPEGITAKGSEQNGATYSSNETMLKWVWAALPSEDEIVVSVTLTPAANATGPKTIAAKYSFVENNAKKVIEMAPAEVNVVPPGTEVATTTPTETKTPQTDTTTSAKTPTETLATNTNNEPPGNVTVIRSISASGTFNEFIITITILKDGTKGFARYSDDIMEGLTAKAIKSDGGSFSVADGKIKFVWVNVPEKDTLMVSYSLSGNITSAVTLFGEYSYLEDNQSKKFKLNPESIAFQRQTPAETQEPITKETPKEENKLNEKEKEKEQTKERIDAVIEKQEASLVYRVQIGAFTNAKVTGKKLSRKFKIDQKIRSEMAEGYTKFMIGSYIEYIDARDNRENIKNSNGVKSAFVVAYNTGKRITVQEALMITNQKWFK